MVIPIGSEGNQELHRITRTEDGFIDEIIEKVSFVPFLAGVSQ